MKTNGAMMAYEAPKVEVIEVKVEQGFAASNQDLTNENWPVTNP